MPEYDVELGIIIKEARKTKNLTQEQLSEVTNLSLKTISNIENGKQHPRYDTIEKISKALGVPIETLVSLGQQEIDPDVELFISELKSATPQAQKVVISSGRAILNCLQIPVQSTTDVK